MARQETECEATRKQTGREAMGLRSYQQDAHDAVIKWVMKSRGPCLIEAATGAGKSHIIAALANTVHKISRGKRILCIVPSAELVVQNHSKFIGTGNPASIYSASVGSKCLKNKVIFATPRSIIAVTKKGSLSKTFAMIIIDEAHGITPTIRAIVNDIRVFSENCRVVGLTATPFRMKSGYIYKKNLVEKRIEEEAEAPFFEALIYKIGARELIKKGYLTPPVISETNAEQYDTSKLRINRMGKFNASDVDEAFVGQGRKTASIVADVVARSASRSGVMFFASTIQHAKEVMNSLPHALSGMVTGQTAKDERREIIRAFKCKELKYIVNVSVLTTGFDVPHIDVIAVLRATESASLLIQIIGRGLRVCKGKVDCLVLDYAENIERHFPDGDIFNPKIKKTTCSEGGQIKAVCEDCDKENMFTARKNEECFDVDKNGYYLDIEGFRVQAEYGEKMVDMPAHFGRRCQALLGEMHNEVQCGYRWSCKECDACNHENDIAARYCSACKAELIDPNDKLIADFKAMKKDPFQVQCDTVVEIEESETVSRTGRDIILLSITTQYRMFKVYLQKNSEIPRARFELKLWENAKKTGYNTVTYKKQQDKNFYNIIAFNEKADICSAS